MDPVKLHIENDINALSLHVADWLVSYIKEVLTKRDRFTIALSGGSTPKKLYQLLATGTYKNKIDWSRLHIFWGDERHVPFTDEKNNAKMAYDTLLSHVAIPADHIHPVQTDTEPHLSAFAYQALLHEYFDKQLYTFDLVLLGLGDNAHTLSLFPGYDEVIFEKQDWVKTFRLVEQNMYRVTLTAPVVNSAGRIAFLVTGNDKAPALQHIISGKYDPTQYPAQIIKPLNGELYWFLDKAAASGLQYAV
jgi:6-phosphogluconolactonase